MEYRHTQIGVVIIAALVVAIVLVLILSTGTFHPIFIAILTILVAALALFYSLSVEIKDNTLICRFGAGLIRKRIPLSEIHQARTVQNPWYAGWGIRWMPGQYWLWNVSGLRAVELIQKDGKRFRLGTDEPESLVHAIETNKAMGT
jgi:uncharacterized membrane protein